MSRLILAIDCETDPFKIGRIPMPFLWGCYDGRDYKEFGHCRDLLDYIKTLGPCLVYAHNGGKFDYHMPGFLDDLEDFAPILLIHGRLARFKIGQAEFRDSYNILPVALRKFGCKLEIDYGKLEASERDKHMDEIRKYLRQDCVGLWETVLRWREEYGSGITLASCAMKYWEAMDNEAPRTTKAFYDAIQPYYFGGRVEAFWKGSMIAPVAMYDICSAYPFAMLHEHPIGSLYSEKEWNGEPLVNQNFYDIACKSTGAFPYRTGTGLSFPADGETRFFQVTGWELAAARDLGLLAKIRIEKVVSFHKRVEFSAYVKHFYNLKQITPKNDPKYIFYKLMLNSLYGKFGADPSEYKEFSLVPPELVNDFTGGGYEFAGELGRHIVMACERPEDKCRFYNVAVAASITGFVRAYLLRAIHQVKFLGSSVLYCDTDSMIVSGQHSPVPIGKELGDWSLEGEFTSVSIGGKKLYALQSADGKWKTSCKGARLDGEQIVRICQGEVIEWENEAPTFGARMDGVRFVKRKIRKT